MSISTTARRAITSVRRHPGRTAAACAVCLPLLAASVFYGSSMASATPTPTLAVAPAELTASPPPDIPAVASQPTAAQPAGGPAAVVKPTPVKIAFNEDGCDHNYGTANQCVPWTIPGSTASAKCAWLRSNGFGSLQVAGTNRQDLTEDGQGYVCASGA